MGVSTQKIPLIHELTDGIEVILLRVIKTSRTFGLTMRST